VAKKIEIERYKNDSTNPFVVDAISALEVINELGGLPLAIDQFAIYINISDNRNRQTHLEILKEKKLEYSEENAVGVTTDLDKARLNVKTTWLMNIETLTKENPNFQLIIDVLSFLDPTGIPSLILDPKIPGLPEEMTALLKDGRIIHKLTKYSLFSREPLDKKLLTVHRMVQDVIKDAVQKDKTRLTKYV